MTIKQTVLAEIIYECVRSYAGLWDITQHAQSTLRAIDRAKQDCADTPEEQDRLVDALTDDAWSRLNAQRTADGKQPAGAHP